MSGSSLDGLDLACVEFEVDTADNNQLAWRLLAGQTLPFTPEWIEILQKLPQANALDFCKTHAQLGHYFGKLTKQFLEAHQLTPDYIASHGHTIFHYPQEGFTVQIGDGAAIAATTGISVISEFRTMDVALGGQGAPLAPLADKFILPGNDFYVNIGGIANISCNIDGKFIAYDTSAANQILNNLAHAIGLEYDDKGSMAASGAVDEELLKQVNQHSYYQQPYPKSLDNGWVLQNVLPIFLQNKASINDKLATAVEHTAQQLVFAIQEIIKKENFVKTAYKMVATGGGVFNDFLIQRIQYHLNKATLAHVELTLPDTDMIKFKEAILMALMGLRRIENLSNSIATVTGASRDSSNGAVYLGQ